MSQMSTHHHKRNAPRPDGRDAWGQPDRSPSLLVLLLAFCRHSKRRGGTPGTASDETGTGPPALAAAILTAEHAASCGQ